MHLLFVDYCKAFDEVPRSILWRVADNRGITLHVIQVIKSMCLETRIQIKHRKPSK